MQEELLWYQVLITFDSMREWQDKITQSLQKPDELENILQELEKDMSAQLNALYTLFAQEMKEEDAKNTFFSIVVYFDEIVQLTLPIEYISYWQQNFQKEFFHIDIGGDRFYDRLLYILEKRNIVSFVYQVYYFCLNDGFKGKYADNPQKIEQYKKEIADVIPEIDIPVENEQQPPPELRTLEQLSVWPYVWNAVLIVICIYMIYYFFAGGKHGG